MATYIRPTPFLYGKDSKKFNAQLRAHEHERISKDEWERMTKLMEAVLANSKKK